MHATKTDKGNELHTEDILKTTIQMTQRGEYAKKKINNCCKVKAIISKALGHANKNCHVGTHVDINNESAEIALTDYGIKR